MKQMSALALQIRDYVNSADLYKKHFKSYLDDWNAVCVAMDTLQDTCLALEYYEINAMGKENGEKYLKLYGFLQAVFLQQDSIRQLYRVFLGKALQPRFDSAWKNIRDLRNLTVGHPIEKRDENGIKRCFISRVTISSAGFQLLVWNTKKGKYEFEDIQLGLLYERYKSEAVEYLESICQAQIRIWGELR